jgi:hypothetical protein
MPGVPNRGSLEQHIAQWREYARKREAVYEVDVEELEDHLRNQVEALGRAGLDEDEAFLVAVKRLGDLDSLSREFAREYSERLWKQLVLTPDPSATSDASNRNAIVAISLAAAACIAFKLPELFGLHIGGAKPATSFYVRNLSLLVLPFLAGYFAWKRELKRASWRALFIPFLAAGLIVNLMPFKPQGQTETLIGLHLPIAMWLMIGFAYAGTQWRSHQERMNYVRFSGEWFIYYALIALGGAVLIGFTVFLFQAIGLSAETLVSEWLLPCGAAGAVLIGAWLVESKQSVIENMAPVLTMVFTPLFALLLLLFVVTMVWTGNALDVGRELLIGFDLLLVLVLGLLLYSISARDPKAPAGLFDRLRLLLVLCALLVDALALWAIAARIAEFGFSPNKVAALGENLILLVNLGWSAVLYTRFLVKRGSFDLLERWQMAYVPVYAIWAGIVVIVFPIVFNFR